MSNEVLFKLIIDLIVALSHWLWPLVLFIILLVCVFRFIVSTHFGSS